MLQLKIIIAAHLEIEHEVNEFLKCYEAKDIISVQFHVGKINQVYAITYLK